MILEKLLVEAGRLSSKTLELGGLISFEHSIVSVSLCFVIL
jgi:hypothetical protein